jgi:signal transduction histidine kinase
LARDENQVTLSGKVILVQETDQDVQAGTLMYSPIYEINKPLDTVEQRQNAIFGWIYSPFRMTDLLHNIVGDSALHLHIYDGDSVEPENLLYKSTDDSPNVIFFEQRRVILNGRVWTLYFEQFTPWNSNNTWITATVGTIISFLFFLFLRAYLMVQNREARLIIQHAEQELSNQELLFHKAANEELLRQNIEKEKRAVELAFANDAKEAFRLQMNQMQKVESIGRLTSGISHDFNNILACMLGYNELNHYISEEMTNEKLSEELKYNTKQVDVAGQRAVTLIKKMMAYSRKETKKESMNVKPTPEVITEVLTMLQPALTSQIKWKVVLNCDDTVQIDEVDLHQILTNLAVNARDAMKERGGIIKISLNKVVNLKSQCVACAETLEGDFIELSLSDNGTGIEPQTISRMFDPFFTTKQVGEGTGLGLFTVSGMVHHSHGHLLVDSTLGEGTTFRLLFPPALLG